MSATVESPMPWRKSYRLTTATGFATGSLLRSTSSQTNLTATVGSRIQTQTSVGLGPKQDVFEVGLVPGEDWSDKVVSPLTTTLTLPRTADSTAAMGGVFSCLVRGRKSPGAGGGQRLTAQLNKLSRQLQTDAMSPSGFLKSGVVECRFMSKSSDRLTDLPKCEPPLSCHLQGFVTAKFDTAPCPSLKPVSPPSPQCSFNNQPPLLTNGIDLTNTADKKNDITVPSVRCELVAELLNSDCYPMYPLIPNDLNSQLQLLILDCRPFVSYNSNHVRGALNVSCADCITRKRMLTGRASLGDLVSGTDDAKDRYKLAISNARTASGTVQFVVYDDDTEDFESLPAGHSLRLVVSCLRKAHVDVYFMYGGLKAFHREYSNLCSRPGSPISRPLRSPSTPAAESCKIDNAKISQILPFLFIGNEHDAANRGLLKQHGISNVLNVTSHVPLHFESDGVTYVRYPAADSGTENLRQYFDDAIQFIDGVREHEGRVMVHCQAGVSRSSTIAIAYVMARSSLSMLDAFRFVKSRRSIVAPNFNFMGQLLDFESALKDGLVPTRPELNIDTLIAADYQVPPATPQFRQYSNDDDVFAN